MEQFEKVEKLREKAGVTFEEAKRVLEENNWDLLDAIVALEKEGKVMEPKASSYTTKAETLATVAYVDEKIGRKDGVFKRFGAWCKELIKKANRNSLEIENDGKVIGTLPVSVFILMLLFCFWVTVPLMIVGLFFNMRYHFSGPDIHSVDVDINAAMDSVAKKAEDIKNEFASSKEERKAEKEAEKVEE